MLRLAAATTVGFGAIGTFPVELAIARLALLAVKIGLSILLFAGLWTPVAGSLVAILKLGSLFWHPGGDVRTRVLVAALGIALALLGPGAWSVDAWLFGWRRIDIPDRHDQSDTTSGPEP